MVVHQDFEVPLATTDKTEKVVAVIPKGYIVSLSHELLNKSPDLFEAPQRFDPDRNQLNNRHGVFPSSGIARSMSGFGLGRHQCPGRFFAAEEIQTALIVMLRLLKLEAQQDFQPSCKNGVQVNDDPLPVTATLTKAGAALFQRVRLQQQS